MELESETERRNREEQGGKLRGLNAEGGRGGGLGGGYGVSLSVLVAQCVVVSDTEPGEGEQGAVEVLRPLEAEAIHDGLTAVAGLQAEAAARGQGFFQHRADRHVHGAEEELEVGTALNL